MNSDHPRHHPPFTLRLPFRLAPGRALPDVKGERAWRGFRIELEKVDGFTGALLLHGFQDASTAIDFLGPLQAALTWCALQEEFSFEANLKPGSVTYADDPELAMESFRKMGIEVDWPIDGMGDGQAPIVYTEGAYVRRTYFGDITVGAELSEASMLDSLIAGLDGELPPAHEKISTALDLYMVSFFERTPRGKLLTLVMALEALITTSERPAVVVELLKEFRTKAAELRESHEKGSPEAEALDALMNELYFKTRSSISSEVRNLARRVAQFLGEDPRAAVADAKAIYQTRSALAHKGTVPDNELADSLLKARSLSRKVMMAALRNPTLILAGR
jgi:hypothetical protein